MAPVVANKYPRVLLSGGFPIQPEKNIIKDPSPLKRIPQKKRMLIFSWRNNTEKIPTQIGVVVTSAVLSAMLMYEIDWIQQRK
tara:strand:- start:235 stop:483 length:249 start_codon:yes stop_codon:yes gene_type:complete